MAFKKDTCSAIIKRDDYGKTGPFGWEIDHNRYKGDNCPAWDCKRKFLPTLIFLPSLMIKRDPATS